MQLPTGARPPTLRPQPSPPDPSGGAAWRCFTPRAPAPATCPAATVAAAAVAAIQTQPLPTPPPAPQKTACACWALAPTPARSLSNSWVWPWTRTRKTCLRCAAAGCGCVRLMLTRAHPPHLLQPLAPALTRPLPSLQDMVVEDLDEDMEGAAAAPAPKPASGGHAGARRVLAWLNGLQRGCCSSWLQPDKAAALFASIDQSPAILCKQRKTWMRTTSRTRRRRCRPSEHSQPLCGLLC